MTDLTRKQFVLIVALIFLASEIIFFRTQASSSKPQDEQAERKVAKKTMRNTPVKVTEVKVRKGVIDVREKFTDDNDDWLKGFSLTFKNTSSKEIVYVQVALTFFSKEGGDAPDRVPYKTYVIYGSMDGSTPHVRPGESATILLNDERYAILQSTLIANNYPLRFRHVEVVIDGVLFSDGLFWQKGSNFYRDPLNPEKWIRDKEFMKGGKYENMKPIGLLRKVPTKTNACLVPIRVVYRHPEL